MIAGVASMFRMCFKDHLKMCDPMPVGKLEPATTEYLPDKSHHSHVQALRSAKSSN